MVGGCISYWKSPFLRDLLVFGGAVVRPSISIYHTYTYGWSGWELGKKLHHLWLLMAFWLQCLDQPLWSKCLPTISGVVGEEESWDRSSPMCTLLSIELSRSKPQSLHNRKTRSVIAKFASELKASVSRMPEHSPCRTRCLLYILCFTLITCFNRAQLSLVTILDTSHNSLSYAFRHTPLVARL